MPKCSELMTREPACCEPAEPITKVAGIMKREDVGAVPVVDSHSSRKLVGMITDRDIVVRVVAEGTSADRATVKDAMSGSPASCRETDDVDQAIRLMAERQVRRMPIVDDQGRLTGIIAQADVATRGDGDARTGEMVERISEPGLSRK